MRYNWLPIFYQLTNQYRTCSFMGNQCKSKFVRFLLNLHKLCRFLCWRRWWCLKSWKTTLFGLRGWFWGESTTVMEIFKNYIEGVIWHAEYGGNNKKFKKSWFSALGVVFWWLGVEYSKIVEKIWKKCLKRKSMRITRWWPLEMGKINPYWIKGLFLGWKYKGCNKFLKLKSDN